MSSTAEMIGSLNKRLADIAAMRKSMVDELKVDFKKFVEDVLRENNFPYLEMRGYTPGFNDGDPCTFGLHIDLAYGEGIDDVQEQFDGIDLSNLEPYRYGSMSEDHKAAARVVEGIFSGIDSLLEDAFGSYGWQVFAAIDAEGNFHYHFNDEYDCGY